MIDHAKRLAAARRVFHVVAAVADDIAQIDDVDVRRYGSLFTAAVVARLVTLDPNTLHDPAVFKHYAVLVHMLKTARDGEK